MAVSIDEDPFASAPADEAQAAPEPEQAPEPPADPEPAPAPAKKAAAKKTNPLVTPVVNVGSTGGKVTMTFKGGSGFDAPWIVIHADDLDDALTQVSEGGKTLAAVMERVQKAGQHFVGLGGGSAPARGGNGGGQQRTSNAPQGAQEAPNGEKRYCEHGEMRFRSQVSKKTGKPYKGFFCTSGDRDNECDAQFLR
jgi:hypothetical protein